MRQICESLIVTGAVQGVGFRPYVKELADQYGLSGTVRNSGGIVRILVRGGEQEVAAFIDALITQAPAGAEGLRVERERCGAGEVPRDRADGMDSAADPERDGVEELDGAPGTGRSGAPGFAIIDSDGDVCDAFPSFVPDLAICPDCMRELRDPADRRFGYPLISCTACGPRFSILHAFPYDRERTTMRDFVMCPRCRAEYAPAEAAASGTFCPERGDKPAIAEHPHIRHRRRHAQTISCPDCGPQMTFVDAAADERLLLECDAGEEGPGEPSESRGQAAASEVWLAPAVQILKKGGILGLKGTGGYQLLADPCCDTAVERLRLLKGRETKPFAIMFPDMESVRAVCLVSEAEEKLLLSAARPIVLLAPRADEHGTWGSCVCGESAFIGAMPSSAWGSSVCGESAFIGAMLPSTGAHQLLADACGPLIVTSANLSGAPMITEDKSFADAFLCTRDSAYADGALVHPRRILAPVDDSVVYVTGEDVPRVHVLRRARGYVPAPLDTDLHAPCDILAFGADLKASFAVMRDGRMILSQPFGDLENLSVRRAFLAELERFSTLYDLHPGLIICDAHPGYHSARIARDYAADHGNLPVRAVYHHHAHILAVMAEHGITSCIGFACDGTGYGADGGIWGGELLHVSLASGERAACAGSCTASEAEGGMPERLWHLPVFRIPGGDQAARDADLSALCVLYGLNGEADRRQNPTDGRGKDAFTRSEAYLSGVLSHSAIPQGRAREILAVLDAGAGIPCTSAGRLFDAAAALLDIAHENTHEGACAQALEAVAHRYLRAAGLTPMQGLALIRRDRTETDPVQSSYLKRFFAELSWQSRAGADAGAGAFAFHAAFAEELIGAALSAAEQTGERMVVLSGGTFANRILAELVRSELEGHGLTVLEACRIPCGDGGIAVGQLYGSDYFK